MVVELTLLSFVLSKPPSSFDLVEVATKVVGVGGFCVVSPVSKIEMMSFNLFAFLTKQSFKNVTA